MTLYVFTSNNGILMLNILKTPFLTSRWKTDPIFRPPNTTDDNQNYLIYKGRLLMDYYDLDYSDSLYAVNSRMMGMLINIKFDEGYHLYVFRCFNLMTNAKSMVNFDKTLETVNECKSMFIEDGSVNDDIVVFTILCDSTIIKITASEKTVVEINTNHSYWQPNGKVLFKIDQDSKFSNESDSLDIEVEVIQSDDITTPAPYLGGLFVAAIVVVGFSVLIKTLLKD